MATKKHKKVNRWIQGTNKHPGAVKHQGALTKAAEQHGKSTLEEAKAESKSPDKRIASRGRLALRFIGKAKHGNIRKHHGPQKRHHAKRVASKG